MNDRAIIYTDGAASPNPGRGGWAAVIVEGEKRRELSGGYQTTTNNRMELVSVIEGLSAVDAGIPVEVVSDSKYVTDMMRGGYPQSWRRRGWMRTRKERALNPDLWQRLLEVCDGRDVTFEWVRGHDGHPENERADELAVEASRRDDLSVDEGYVDPPDMSGPTLFDL